MFGNKGIIFTLDLAIIAVVFLLIIAYSVNSHYTVNDIDKIKFSDDLVFKESKCFFSGADCQIENYAEWNICRNLPVVKNIDRAVCIGGN
jgi:hypothetical protein